MKTLNKKAFSVIEYILLLVIIIGAFLVLRDYIRRGIYGMWQQAGTSFAFGRQYDPQKSAECAYDQRSNKWYDRTCFEYGVAKRNPPCNSGDYACEKDVIANCASSGSMCDQLN